jgi:hypothetical protein
VIRECSMPLTYDRQKVNTMQMRERTCSSRRAAPE